MRSIRLSKYTLKDAFSGTAHGNVSYLGLFWLGLFCLGLVVLVADMPLNSLFLK
jgi:hypothetical protein